MLFAISMFSINATAAWADRAAEIDYLFSFIGQSECVFIRNGDEHNAQDARKHIEKKYNYLKSRIESADDLIRLAATKSSFSGKPYKVRCGDELLTSEQWLQTALEDYRTAH